MEIKHKDLIVDDEKPFSSCKLNRENNAKVLTSIVESYADGFVLALNNKWGTGKTTFVRMWEKHLQNNKFKTLHFNAWENDFEMDPLPAMLAELKGVIGSKNGRFNSLLEKAAEATKIILPSIGKNIAKKYLGEDASEIIFSSTEAAAGFLKDEVEQYFKKKEGMHSFKEELKQLVENTDSNNKPFIFIIDELDRCRPDYAVEVLEIMKHFFSVPGIIFILSIDKEQLGYAIQGYYGSANIDTDEYLRRFIDIEYSLPEPDHELFTKYLLDYYGYKEFFDNNVRSSQDSDFGDFKSFSAYIAKAFNYSLRQQEKTLAHARIVLRTLGSLQEISIPSVIVLVHLKLLEKRLYDAIKEANLEMQEFIDKIEFLFTFNPQSSYYHALVYTMADLALCYNFYYLKIHTSYGNTNMLLGEAKEGNRNSRKLTIKSITDKYKENNNITTLEKAVNDCCYYNEHQYASKHLAYYLKKVDILDNLKD